MAFLKYQSQCANFWSETSSQHAHF